MSDEASNNNLSSYLMFPAMQSTVSAGVALKRHGKDVFKVQNRKGFNELNKAMKSQGYDCFTRAQALEKGYDHYKDLATAKAKASKKFAKYNKLAKKTKLPLSQRILNVFRPNNKITLEKYHESLMKKYGVIIENGSEVTTKSLKSAKDAINNADEALKSLGKNFNLKDAKKFDKAVMSLDSSEKTAKYLGNLEDTFNFKNIGKNAVKTGAKASAKNAAKGAMGYFKNNFKNEVGLKHGKFNYVMTAMQFIPNIINEVIPAFKEGGFKEGIKATGKTLARAGADLFGYALGGSIGRTVGAVVGAVICPFKGTGAKVGGMIGDMLFSMIIGGKVTSTVDKIVGADKATEENVEQNIQPQLQTANAPVSFSSSNLTELQKQELLSEQRRNEINQRNGHLPVGNNVSYRA